MPPNPPIHSLLLVRNSVDHDARVLRAARVARHALGGRTLVVGVAAAPAPAGETRVEGVPVLRLPARHPRLERLERLAREFGRRASPNQPSKGNAFHQPEGMTTRLTPMDRARRTLSGLSFALQALALARRLQPRLVHANDWNTMWVGLFIKRLCGSRLVYDSHELWADRNGRWEWRPWLLACEALFVHAADEVLTSSPGYADALAARYRIPRPSVVRNIPDGNARRTLRITESLSVRDGPNISASAVLGANTAPVSRSQPATPLVVYIGGLMPGRGLEQMIDALPLLATIRLRVVGPGAPRYRDGLLARAEAVGALNRLDLRSAVAPGEVPDILADATAGLCLIQPICRSYELCLPNKLFEYAAAGVPVLASDLPVIGAVVRREGFGALAPAADPHGIAASLERLLEPEGWQLAAQRARAFAEKHSWAEEAQTLTAVYRRGQAVARVTGAST